MDLSDIPEQPSGDLLLWPFSAVAIDKIPWKLSIFQENGLEKMGIRRDAGIPGRFAELWNPPQHCVRVAFHRLTAQ